MSQQHHFIMMCHIVIGYGNSCGPMNRINQPIITIRQRAMVDPDMFSSKDRHSITVRHSPPTRVLWGVPYITISPSLAIVNVDAVDYDICRVMDRYAWPTCHVDAGPTPVDGFE